MPVEQGHTHQGAKVEQVRVLHVTETMGGGVVTFLDSITRRQAQAGARPTVLYVRQDDTPSAEVLRERFDAEVELIELAGVAGRSPRTALALARAVHKIRPSEYEAVHLHSSIAGMVGRVAMRRGHHLSYTPHGFAFLRENVSVRWRSVITLIERVLARRGQTMVISASEMTLAREVLHARRAVILQPGVPSSAIPAAPSLSTTASANGGRPLVLITARLVYQKAPWRFAAVAHELGHLADFVWVGASQEEADKSGWMGRAPVSFVPWVRPAQLHELLGRADVYLFPTLWEGKSLSLIEAQAWGIPAVTTDVVGNRDTVIDGKTGFVCRTDSELFAAVEALLTDEQLRHEMGTAAREHACFALTDDTMGIDSLRLYAEDGAPSDPLD